MNIQSSPLKNISENSCNLHISVVKVQYIREHAAAAGDSVQGYLLDAVRERMDREDQEKE